MAYKIGFISLGCPKNQVDAEHMLAAMDAAGMEITDFIEDADAVVVNTCGFIDEAKAEAIENILNMVELKKDGMIQKIVVAGCLAQRHQEEIFSEIPEVDAVIGVGAAGDIVKVLERVLSGETLSYFPPQSALPLSGERILSTPEYWAYLKIADGCSNQCTYCTIPGIRGAFRSRPMEEIVAEAKDLVAGGVRELVLVAQDTTNYGIDLYGGYKLPALLEELCTIEDLRWIRLLYCYPDKVTDKLLDTMASNKKILHYIDLPLQHISDKILAAMNRRGSAAEIRALIARIREKMPDVMIRTTFITGFPGETEEDFDQLVDFVNETEFDRLGCFSFSAQEGTPAYDMPDQIEDEVKAKRGEIIMQDQYEIVAVKNNERMNQVYEVLVEGYDHYTDSYYGRSYMDAPEIDTQIYFTGSGDYEEGTFVEVEVLGINEYDLLGRATS